MYCSHWTAIKNPACLLEMFKRTLRRERAYCNLRLEIARCSSSSRHFCSSRRFPSSSHSKGLLCNWKQLHEYVLGLFGGRSIVLSGSLEEPNVCIDVGGRPLPLPLARRRPPPSPYIFVSKIGSKRQRTYTTHSPRPPLLWRNPQCYLWR
jgi:hypothetical protein